MSYEDHVRRFADRMGIGLDDEEAAAHAETAAGLADQYGALEPEPPSNLPATDIEEGSDDANAIRYRFRLPSDEENETGRTDGPLSGVDVAVKENLAVAGVPMHCGSAALSFEPAYHATAVSRLREAGADVVATTNMDEFAYFTTGETCAFGPIENPAAEGRVPGGSSSGSAAAVAAGDVALALGSDTGGSVRIPASFCGVVGLKPTHRHVPRFGFADLAPSLDHVGPLAPDVATAARAYDALAGPDPRDPSSLAASPSRDAAAGLDASADDLTVGVVTPAMADADEGVRETVEAAIASLSAAGCRTERVELPGFRTATPAALATAGAEFASLSAADGQLLGSGTGHSETWRVALAEALRSPDLGENVREQLLTAGALNEARLDRYVAARGVAAEFTAAVDAALADHDALVTPTTPMTAPPFAAVDSPAAFARTVANTAPFNLTGHPALSVPVGSVDVGTAGDGSVEAGAGDGSVEAGTVDGAPVGVQFVAVRDDERTLMTLGSALEATVAD